MLGAAFMVCVRRTDATNVPLGSQETTAPTSSSGHLRLLELLSWLDSCVSTRDPREGEIPRLGNSHLCHRNSLTAHRSSAHSAAFPTGTVLTDSVPSPHFSVNHSRSLALLTHCQSSLGWTVVKSERKTQKAKPRRSCSLH